MSDETPDLYAVLGITAQATPAEISHAYRSLLRHHHPDTRGIGDQAHATASDNALQQVLAAYSVLGDPVRRAAYDRGVAARSQPVIVRRQPQHPRPPRGSSVPTPPIVAGPVRWHRGPL
ncbi:J domain-containing protein [Jatrophihabitans cynanchi]|jgi:DnaJ-class molecular chaperone|uniref:J domain-containing protein n=1 Tax=Jatrophihabitans cynanchi TaxID=2944128 RepID=A0ABY7JVS9_9ACTN|nr:J domain-containing protein [Jatrophihabitans sp. SB3-54]WAX55783.1 J domain-containing protein [Jatrophihabitans sp. SB3-54]